MMISPESYYELYLKGKTEKEIRTAIRGLKNEIGRLKNIAEHPEYQCMISPSEDVQIWSNRLYLKEAKKALAEVGGVYKPSKAELKVQEFDDNIFNIIKIEFSIGGYFDGYTKTTIIVDENIHKYVEHSLVTQPSMSPDNDEPERMSAEDFLYEFSELHIGEWRKNYVAPHILDGTQWSLVLYYSNGMRPAKYYGSNAFPYNFNKLCELFELEGEDV